MSTATSTQTSSTECPSTESSTTAADPVLTREEAIAILAGPDSELPELLKRAGALLQRDARSMKKGFNQFTYLP